MRIAASLSGSALPMLRMTRSPVGHDQAKLKRTFWLVKQSTNSASVRQPAGIFASVSVGAPYFAVSLPLSSESMLVHSDSGRWCTVTMHALLLQNLIATSARKPRSTAAPEQVARPLFGAVQVLPASSHVCRAASGSAPSSKPAPAVGADAVGVPRTGAAVAAAAAAVGAAVVSESRS